jgi:hypothetical protein
MKYIFNLCETFLRNDCDPSKSHLSKNQKITSAILKDDENSLVIFDDQFSINVIFEPEILQENLEINKLKNVGDLVSKESK